jgi:hypothetical protein
LGFAEPVRRSLAEGKSEFVEVRNLVTFLGTTSTLAAITFIAFLCGALWVEVIPLAVSAILVVLRNSLSVRRVRRHVRKHYDLDAAARLASRGPDEVTRSMLRQAVFARIREAYGTDEQFRDVYHKKIASLPPQRLPAGSSAVDDIIIEKVIDMRGVENRLLGDLGNVPARLLGKEPEVWSAWDRMKSEGEFRQSTATALVPLIAISSMRFSPWYLPAVLACIVFWMVGERKARAAEALLVGSVVAGRVPLNELEKVVDLNQVPWSKGLPDESNQPSRSWQEFGLEIERSRREFEERQRQERGARKDEAKPDA